VFATLTRLRARGLVISPGTFFSAQSEGLAALTVRHSMPAIFQYRPFVVAGGLLSYGSSETEYFGLVGSYAARILKGEKPGNLPVQQPTKVELLINLNTARALGLTIPPSLLARADEVIE
jgi:putative ABC transport system substrate-binding protein